MKKTLQLADGEWVVDRMTLLASLQASTSQETAKPPPGVSQDHWGLLHRLVARAQLNGEPVTVEFFLQMDEDEATDLIQAAREVDVAAESFRRERKAKLASAAAGGEGDGLGEG